MKEAPFAIIAHKIGDPRLEKPLCDLAAQIKNEVHNAKFVPLRADVRSDVKRLKAETRRFEIALKRVGKRLLDLPSRGIECLPMAHQTAQDIMALCDRTLSITSAKGGRGKKPGRITCAWIVSEAWAFVHGRLPNASNEKVQGICDSYWLACGGAPESDLSNWRRPITEALSTQSALRRFIRDEIRRCTE